MCRNSWRNPWFPAWSCVPHPVLSPRVLPPGRTCVPFPVGHWSPVWSRTLLPWLMASWGSGGAEQGLSPLGSPHGLPWAFLQPGTRAALAQAHLCCCCPCSQRLSCGSATRLGSFLLNSFFFFFSLFLAPVLWIAGLSAGGRDQGSSPLCTTEEQCGFRLSLCQPAEQTPESQGGL